MAVTIRRFSRTVDGSNRGDTARAKAQKKLRSIFEPAGGRRSEL